MEGISFDGEPYLAYKTWPLHVALLRGTTADLEGNVSMEKEALRLGGALRTRIFQQFSRGNSRCFMRNRCEITSF